MARAMLRDDYNRGPASSLNGGGVRLDDDGRSSVPTGIRDTPGPGVPGETPPPAHSVGPVVTVRERISQGFDDDGNPKWGWQDVVSNVETIAVEDRQEISDNAGSVLVSATVTFLYPDDYAPIRETAQVRLEGKLWRVVKVIPAPGRTTLKLERNE